MKKSFKKIIAILFCFIFIGGGAFLIAYSNGFSGLRNNSEPKEGQIKVACIGDSITYGHGVSNWKNNNYPAVLQKILKDEYHVRNFGVSGYCVQDDANKPYLDLDIYKESLEYKADIVVFMMGSNDAKPYNWKNEEEFKKDLLILVDSYKYSRIILCTPATVFKENFDIQKEEVEIIAKIVKEVAIELNLELIDINALTSSHSEWFEADGIHPDKNGAKAIAIEVAEKILN